MFYPHTPSGAAWRQGLGRGARLQVLQREALAGAAAHAVVERGVVRAAVRLRAAIVVLLVAEREAVRHAAGGTPGQRLRVGAAADSVVAPHAQGGPLWGRPERVAVLPPRAAQERAGAGALRSGKAALQRLAGGQAEGAHRRSAPRHCQRIAALPAQVSSVQGPAQPMSVSH